MSIMTNVKDLFQQKTLLSFELFPPKTDRGMEALCRESGVLDQLYLLNPDYISCTYRTDGTNAVRQFEVLSKILDDSKTRPLAHITCVGNTRDSIREKLDRCLDMGIDHILALRGDIPMDTTDLVHDLPHATDLVEFIRKEYGDQFTIAVSGSPEGHIQCTSLEADISYLKMKQDLGADYAITQLCWDMEQFKYWYEAVRKAGVTLPIDIGVMPVVDSAATINMALSHNGCVIPRALSEIISRHWIFPNVFAPDEPEEVVRKKKEEFKEEGIRYTIDQINEYLSMGVEGIHLFALNRSENVTRIVKESNLSKLLN